MHSVHTALIFQIIKQNDEVYRKVQINMSETMIN